MICICREGINDSEHIAVTGGVYDIPQRIKREIDPGYFVMLRRCDGVFEVHHRDSFPTMEIEIPFQELDARTIDYLRGHDISRLHQITDEIERQQAALERDQQRKLTDARDELWSQARHQEHSRKV